MPLQNFVDKFVVDIDIHFRYAKEHGIRLVRIPYSPYFKKVSKMVSQQLVPLLGDEH